MSEANQVNLTNETAPSQESLSPETLNSLFAQLNPNHIEQFYKSYQSWTLQQQRIALITHIATLQQKITENAEQMQQLAPSALALASLTQLQASGVEDVDLLERMLERGEVWLDHTIQLLVRCEQLDVIGSNYTEWCEHALEGAYDWIDSIGEDNDETSTTPTGVEQGRTETTMEYSVQITEELMLQKLMSDGDDEEADETEKLPMVGISRITQPLSTQDELSSNDEYIEIQDTIQELEDTPVAEDQLQLSAEATCEVHEIEGIGEEEQAEPVEVSTEPLDTQTSLVEEPITIPSLEWLPDSVINDQLASSSLDIEVTEISPSMQANQVLPELSLDAQPARSAPVDHQQANGASFEPVDAIEVGEEQSADVSTSEEREQASLGEPVEQESVEEAGFELIDAIEVGAEQLADISTSEEKEQASLGEPVEQESVEEAGFELTDAIEVGEEQLADISTSEEKEQASLGEPIEQERVEEASFEPVDAIGMGKEQSVDVSTSEGREQASLVELVEQEQVEEANFEPTDAIEVEEEQAADVSASEGREQASLGEHTEQESVEEAGFELADAIEVEEEQLADVSTSEEREQASLAEPVEQEHVEEVSFEPVDAIEVEEEEQSADVSTSEGREQASLGEHTEQERVEEAGFELTDAIEVEEEQLADVSTSEEREQASLVEPVEQEHVEEVSFEPVDAIEVEEEQSVGVSTSEGREQASLAEPVEQEHVEEASFEPVDAIEVEEEQSADVSTSEGREQASLAEPVEQEHVEEASFELTDAIEVGEELVEEEIQEKKPQQEAIPSKRGFLRRLLTRVRGR